VAGQIVQQGLSAIQMFITRVLPVVVFGKRMIWVLPGAMFQMDFSKQALLAL
jgi:hypothetical protein